MGRNTRSIETGRNTGPIEMEENAGPIETDRNSRPIETDRNTGPFEMGRNNGPFEMGKNAGPFETGRNTGWNTRLMNARPIENGRNTRSMNFVRGIIEDNGRDMIGGSQFSRYSVDQNADIVHIKLMRNNSFVTVTDSKGNKKVGASAGSLSRMKGGPKVSRYGAEATAEHVGRLARNMGLKSVVVKVNGFTHFKRRNKQF